jgi:hypothetical protein
MSFTFKEGTPEVIHVQHNIYGTETWTLRIVDQKYLESFKIFWRRMEKMSWADCVRNEEYYTALKKKEYLSYNKVGRVNGLVTFCVETDFKTHIRTEDRMRDRSDMKMRKKT